MRRLGGGRGCGGCGGCGAAGAGGANSCVVVVMVAAVVVFFTKRDMASAGIWSRGAHQGGGGREGCGCRGGDLAGAAPAAAVVVRLAFFNGFSSGRRFLERGARGGLGGLGGSGGLGVGGDAAGRCRLASGSAGRSRRSGVVLIRRYAKEGGGAGGRSEGTPRGLGGGGGRLDVKNL